MNKLFRYFEKNPKVPIVGAIVSFIGLLVCLVAIGIMTYNK